MHKLWHYLIWTLKLVSCTLKEIYAHALHQSNHGLSSRSIKLLLGFLILLYLNIALVQISLLKYLTKCMHVGLWLTFVWFLKITFMQIAIYYVYPCTEAINNL